MFYINPFLVFERDELYRFHNATQARSRYAAARSGYVSVHAPAAVRTKYRRLQSACLCIGKAVQFCNWLNYINGLESGKGK